MHKNGIIFVASTLLSVLAVAGCLKASRITEPGSDVVPHFSKGGATVANGWYEGDEIYYIDGGMEEGVTSRGKNQIYLIGGNRMYQAQVVHFIPGEPGYSPHWNVNVVHTAAGKTLADILGSSFVSEHYPEALFDDVEDILGAEDAGLVVIAHPGAVVLCPVVSEAVADAPGNTELSEEFPPFPDTF